MTVLIDQRRWHLFLVAMKVLARAEKPSWRRRDWLPGDRRFRRWAVRRLRACE